MPYVVAVPSLCICSFFLVSPFPIDWPPHGGPCRRTWTDIVGRPGSGNRYNCTNAMGRARGSSRVNNVQQASASADGVHDGSALQDSPPSPFIMHHDHGHMLSYIRISGDELGGTRGRNGRAQPSYSSYVQVRALSLSPAFSNRRFHFAHVSRLGAHHTIPRAALISCSTRVVD